MDKIIIQRMLKKKENPDTIEFNTNSKTITIGNLMMMMMIRWDVKEKTLISIKQDISIESGKTTIAHVSRISKLLS